MRRSNPALMRACAACFFSAAVSCGPSESTSPLSPQNPRGYSEGGPCGPVPCDGGIDQTDTHVTADVTFTTTADVSLSEPIYDAATDQTVSSFTETSDPETVHVEAGYTSTGGTVVTTSFTNGVDPGAAADVQTTQISSNSNDLSLLDGNYQPSQLPDPYEPVAGGANPIGLVGSTTNGDVTAGIVVDDNRSITAAQTRVSGMRTPDIRPRQSALQEVLVAGPQIMNAIRVQMGILPAG